MLLGFRVSVAVVAVGLVAALAAGDDQDEKKVVLKVGDAAPAFESRTDSDATWNSADRFGKKWVVVYFYPGDFTPGCTAQANAFRDAMHKLTEQGVEVVGISGDAVATHELFKKAQKLNFTLLSDEDGAVAKKFGVPVTPGATVKTKGADGKVLELKRSSTIARWTFLVGKDGKLAYINPKVDPIKDAKNIVEFIGKAEEK